MSENLKMVQLTMPEVVLIAKADTAMHVTRKLAQGEKLGMFGQLSLAAAMLAATEVYSEAWEKALEAHGLKHEDGENWVLDHNTGIATSKVIDKMTRNCEDCPVKGMCAEIEKEASCQ